MLSNFRVTSTDGDYHFFTLDVDKEPYYGIAFLFFNNFKLTFIARKGAENPSYFKKDKHEQISQYINAELNG